MLRRRPDFTTSVSRGLGARFRAEVESVYSDSMPMTIDQIAEAALALPSEARALLADRLVESLDAAEANRIDKLWATEAKRRRDEVRQGQVQTIPGDEALARVRRSLGRWGIAYGILYTIESDFVLIIAVAHCSREPGYWKQRIA